MLAIVAGEGTLPRLVYDHVAGRGDAPLVVELEEHRSEIPGISPIRFRIEHLGSLLADLRARGVTELCLVGRIERPVVDPAQIDAATEPFVPGIMAALQAGDDGGLREVIFILEEFGFALRGAHQIMPDLLPPSGIPSAARPSSRDVADARRGAQVAALIGQADIGQACVIAGGQVLAVETLGGTDWMLRSLARARPTQAAKGGILFKAPKPGQERRADLPVVGPDTVKGVRAAGLGGIVVEAGGVMVLDMGELVAACDAAGLFLWVREPD